MTEKTWRQITGCVGAVIGLLAAVVLIEHLKWLVNPILATLAPFLIAILIAFLLNPLLMRLEKHGMSRALSVAFTSLVFLLIFAATIFLLVPQLVTQGTDLAHSMPNYVRAIEKGVTDLLSRQETLLARFNLPTTIPELARRFPAQIRGFSTSALNAVSGFVLASASKMTWIVIIPLLTVWLLINWDGQREAFHRLLPEAHRDRITRIVHSVGLVLNSYVRGALVLAVLYGVTTALVLGLIFRMPYALVLGLVAGLVSPIPYIGSFVILLSTGIVAYATNPSLGYVGAVLGAMIVQNNVLFDNVISPRVLGGSVGLSLPLSVFALMLGGSLFGVAGMILAVPVGAAIKVLLLELFPKLRGIEPEEQKAEQ